MRPIRDFFAGLSPSGAGRRAALEVLSGAGLARSGVRTAPPGPRVPVLDWDLEMRPVRMHTPREQLHSLEEENSRLRATLAGLATLREELPDDLAARLAALAPEELDPSPPALPAPRDEEEYLGFVPSRTQPELGGSEWSW